MTLGWGGGAGVMAFMVDAMGRSLPQLSWPTCKAGNFGIAKEDKISFVPSPRRCANAKKHVRISKGRHTAATERNTTQTMKDWFPKKCRFSIGKYHAREKTLKKRKDFHSTPTFDPPGRGASAM